MKKEEEVGFPSVLAQPGDGVPVDLLGRGDQVGFSPVRRVDVGVETPFEPGGVFSGDPVIAIDRRRPITVFLQDDAESVCWESPSASC